MAEQALNGKKWYLESSENFEKFMATQGVGIIMRKIGNSTKNYEEWTVKDNAWKLAITSTFKNKNIEFKIGEEFDDVTLDGREVKTTFTLDGDKLIQSQKGKPHDTIITRQVDGDVLTVTYDIPGVPEATCIRKYKLQ